MDIESVSVALCTYNGARFLEAQLQSLANQTRPPDEVIVSDDASTDTTINVAGRALQDLRLRHRLHCNSTNLGFRKNFELAIHECSGDIIFFCDQDDYWAPGKIERHLREYAKDPSILLVASDSVIVDENLAPTGFTQFGNCHFGARYLRRLRANPLRVFLQIRPIPGHAISVRKELLKWYFPLPSGWAHDEWACVLAAYIGKVSVVPELLTCYRRHASQTVGTLSTPLIKMAQGGPSDNAQLFLTEVGRFEAMRERMSTIGAQGLDEAPKRRLISNKIEFLKARANMRTHPLRRPYLILRELLAYRYFSVGQGWLSFARDLLAK